MTSSTKDLLIVWHSRTGASRAIAEAAFEQAEGNADLLAAEHVKIEDLLSASAYLFVCPENLASMSGIMKEMFDRTYYPVLGKIEGRPFATIIAAGSDGEGAQRQIDRIAKGWRLKRVADRLIIRFDAQSSEAILAAKTVSDANLQQCRELGAALAEGVRLGVF
ncbi:NAD(P)H-dependent oxidoreductase [Pontixanthobacter gangjinensis]|uniref:Flavodoxin family protein n=1 Tax=Pontixanthobacter gangjinensis TaxID=1028742 RepID=A0A6I4SMY9_9SPHN|nr:NAD(P)H-dependent oxidoreductase [Pontixanthobacter gangjinensis]MXO57113.1 flavodoxin family protein [Pontixanthobacter gangjinensis]